MISNIVWIGLGSLAGFLLGMAAAAIILVKLPADYFQRHLAEHRQYEHPARHWTWVVARNVLGVVLLVAGIAMLVLPGQGVLTVVLGLMLIDFPGKRALLRKLLTNARFLGAANRFRARFGKPPLEAPATASNA